MSGVCGLLVLRRGGRGVQKRRVFGERREGGEGRGRGEERGGAAAAPAERDHL